MTKLLKLEFLESPHANDTPVGEDYFAWRLYLVNDKAMYFDHEGSCRAYNWPGVVGFFLKAMR